MIITTTKINPTPAMSDKTESPALLSPERLEQMAMWAKTLQGPRSGPAHVRDGQMIDELLADRAAFRQQVAAELASLLEEPTEHKDTSYDEESYWVAIDLMQEKARALATRLGLDLSAPTS